MFRPVLIALTGIGLITTAPAPSKSESPCPGNTTIEMRSCAAQQLEQSLRKLTNKLTAAELGQWTAATRVVCDIAYHPYRDGSIHGQLVTGCHDRLNNALLQEFRGLEEPR